MLGLQACLPSAWAEPLPSDPTMFVEPVLLSSNWVYFPLLGRYKWMRLSRADLQEEVTSMRVRTLTAQSLHLNSPAPGSLRTRVRVCQCDHYTSGCMELYLSGRHPLQKPQKVAQLVIFSAANWI